VVHATKDCAAGAARGDDVLLQLLAVISQLITIMSAEEQQVATEQTEQKISKRFVVSNLHNFCLKYRFSDVVTLSPTASRSAWPRPPPRRKLRLRLPPTSRRRFDFFQILFGLFLNSFSPSLNVQEAAADAVNEDEMSGEAYYDLRMQAIANLQANGVPAYPYKFNATMSVPQYVQQYANLAVKETLNEVTVSLAGRMYRRHSSGAKLFFFDIRADQGQVQIFVDKRFVMFLMCQIILLM
jgi:hypothetical protein